MVSSIDSFLPSSYSTPQEIGVPVFWLDVPNSSKRILINNNEIFCFLDFASTASICHINRTETTERTTLTTINGKPALQGRTTTGFLFSFIPVFNTELTFFIVYKNNDGLLFSMLGNNPGLFNVFLLDDSGVTFDNSVVAAVPELDDNESHILSVRWKSDPGDILVKVDDKIESSIGTKTTDNKIGGPGGRGFFNTLLMTNISSTIGSNGAVGEVIYYYNYMNDNNFNKIGNYLCSKWKLPWSNV